MSASASRGLAHVSHRQHQKGEGPGDDNVYEKTTKKEKKNNHTESLHLIDGDILDDIRQDPARVEAVRPQALRAQFLGQ